jgi:chlorophyllide a reductase subunit Z
MDQVAATPTRMFEELAWEHDAIAALDKLVDTTPILTRISTTKRLRDAAENSARKSGKQKVTTIDVSSANELLATTGDI